MSTLIRYLRLHPVVLFLLVGTLISMTFILLWVRPGDTESVQVRRGKMIESVYGIGTVNSRKVFRGRVAVAGGIEEIFVREGQFVDMGHSLVRLDGGFIIRAPFPGTVTSIPFFAGETVLPNDTIITMEDLDDLYVVATLEQQGAMRVRTKMESRLSFESMRNESFKGLVHSIYPQEDRFLVRITVASLPPMILPGMTVDVAIQVASHDDALMIPERAISDGKVVVLKDGEKEEVDVSVGITDGRWVEVLSGNIEEGDRVLLPGL